MQSINLTNIKKGKRFNNIRHLAEAAGTPLPKGKLNRHHYDSVYTIWNNYFEWEKVPNTKQIKITKVYENKSEELFSSSRSIYQNEVCKILLHLINVKHTKTNSIRPHFNDLINDIGYTYCQNISEYDSEQFNKEEIRMIQKKLYSGYKRIIRNALEYLNKNKVLESEEEEIIIYKDGSKHKANKIDLGVINPIKARAYLQGDGYYSIYRKELKEASNGEWIDSYSYIRLKIINKDYSDDKYILSKDELEELQKKVFNSAFTRLIEEYEPRDNSLYETTTNKLKKNGINWVINPEKTKV